MTKSTKVERRTVKEDAVNAFRTKDVVMNNVDGVVTVTKNQYKLGMSPEEIEAFIWSLTSEEYLEFLGALSRRERRYYEKQVRKPVLKLRYSFKNMKNHAG